MRDTLPDGRHTPTYPLAGRHIPTWVSLLDRGAVCIYPTDSIYGVGGVATPAVADAVTRIKGRGTGKSYSVIAPSVAWIRRHCIVPASFDFSYREPTTYLLRKRDASSFRHLSETDRIGVRLLPPDHLIQRLVVALDAPLISTSANRSGEASRPTARAMDPSFVSSVDFVIDGGPLSSSPSRLYDVDSGREIPRT